MKRQEMLNILTKWLQEDDKDGRFTPYQRAGHLLNIIELNGMKPPVLPQRHCQALDRIYYMGATYHQWEEDFNKDEKLVEELKEMERVDNMTPEERKARVKEFFRKTRASR